MPPPSGHSPSGHSPAGNAMSETAGAATVIWVVSDGTAGMRLQSIALADALTRHRPDWATDEFIIHPHRLIRAFPRLGALLPGMPLYAPAKLGRVHTATGNIEKRPHAGRYPDILITCGRRMAGYALAMRCRAARDGKVIQIIHLQDPKLPPRLFDALIVPQHDRTRGDNVLVTTGSLNRLTLTSIQKAMMDLPSRWLGAAKRTAVTVMLGGDSRRYKVTGEMADAMADRLAEFARATDAQLLIVASRRTPDGLIDRITGQLAPDQVMLPKPDEPNVYPGVLGLGQAVIVSSDSVNMPSEAAITGKPVLIAPWQDGGTNNPSGERGRIRVFHDSMMAAGHTAPLGKTIPNGTFERLDEMDGLTERLLALLGR